MSIILSQGTEDTSNAICGLSEPGDLELEASTIKKVLNQCLNCGNLISWLFSALFDLSHGLFLDTFKILGQCENIMGATEQIL